MRQAMLLSLVLSLSSAFAQDDEVYLGDIGVATDLPEGWSIPRWGDAYLTAVDDRKTTEVRVTYTPYQVDVGPDSGRVWAELTADRLEEEGHSDIEIGTIEVAELDGRRTALIEMTYAYEGTQPATLVQRSFAIEGATLHIAATGVKRNAGRARRGLEFWDEQLSVTKPANALVYGGEVSTDAGFSTTLPASYRLPIGPELNWLRDVVAETLKETIDAESCWVALKPRADGQTNALLQCRLVFYQGVLNERSFSGIEETIYRPYFFSGVAVDPAVPVETGGDRLSLLYDLPDIAGHSAWMGVTQYDQGHVMTYAVGPDDESGLDAGIKAVLGSEVFSGPEGGHHPMGLYVWLRYAVAYHPTHPALLGAGGGVVLFMGFVVWLARRGRKPIED
jgi:hypothetical protein